MQAHTYSWQVRQESRLDAFLRAQIPPLLEQASAVSNSKIRRLIIAGAVQVNGRQCRAPAFVLRPPAQVRVALQEHKFFYEKQPDDIAFTLTEAAVLYEDEVLIVVNKPALLPTEAGFVRERRNMHQAVVDYLWRRQPSLRNPPYVGIMHRLDRETSGALLFTKSRSVNAAMQACFAQHGVVKRYRAVCGLQRQHEAPPETFTVETCIGRISPKGAACKMGPVPEERGGLPARTDFHIVAVRQVRYYVDCLLHSGRTHQIRVHLSTQGLPILGDTLYGGAALPDGMAQRVMLHAAYLAFPHPLTGADMAFSAPLPAGFAPS